MRENIHMAPLMEGGTGTKSKEILQPRDFPEGYEAGTLNSPGIIGLGAAAVFVKKIGVGAIMKHERDLMRRLEEGLGKIDGVTLYGTGNVMEKTAVAAFNIRGYESEEAAMILNDRYGIAVRGGLHCSGTAHDTIGTGKMGCVRMSPGFYTCEDEIDEAVKAVEEMGCALLVISFVSYDLKAPVDLFQQDYAHHLMRECHSGKGKFKVGSHAYFFREAREPPITNTSELFPARARLSIFLESETEESPLPSISRVIT